MAIAEVSAGGVVYRYEGDVLLILMIEDDRGRWSFPKGRVPPHEETTAAALREIAEETGIQGELISLVGDSKYVYRRRGMIVNKTVYFYLVRATSTAITPQYEEVRDARWMPAREALKRSAFPANTALLKQAIELIEQGQPI